jgi:DNA-directed RNA polymerase specialized sigma24 family protein
MALLMNVVGELPVRSVAVAMETSEGAVEQLIARARRTLRLNIGRHIGNQ